MLIIKLLNIFLEWSMVLLVSMLRISFCVVFVFICEELVIILVLIIGIIVMLVCCCIVYCGLYVIVIIVVFIDLV